MKRISRIPITLGLLLIVALATLVPTTSLTAEKAVQNDFPMLEKYSELIKSWHEEEQSDQEDESDKAEQTAPIDLIARLIAIPSGETKSSEDEIDAKVEAIMLLEKLLEQYDTGKELDTADLDIPQAEHLLNQSELLQLPPAFSALLIAPLAKWLAKDFQAKINSPELEDQLARFTLFLGGDKPTQQILAPFLAPWGTSTITMQTLSGHTSPIYYIAFNPNGRYLATESWDGTTKIWDVSTGTCIQTLTGQRGIPGVAFSPDDKLLATGYSDHTAKIWNVATKTCIQTLTGHTDNVHSVSFSPDGRYLATGSWDNTAKIWDVSTGTCIQTLTGHTYRVYSVAFSPDGKLLATGSYDRTAKIWQRIPMAVTPAEKIIYEAFTQSGLESVYLFKPLSYGAQIIKKLNARSNTIEEIIPEKTMRWGTSALGKLATWLYEPEKDKKEN